MTTNRSSEELAMRDRIEAWGRARWPDARVVHELVCGECRIDMAFVRPSDLIGVEIKSSKDVMTRAEKQYKAFNAMLPEVWIAIAPKWKDAKDKPFFSNEMIVTPEEGVKPSYPGAGWRARRNGLVYCDMLHLLWAEEARQIAFRHRLDVTKRTPQHTVTPMLALKLTGEQILHEVCRELRGRNAFWKADAPIYEVAA